MTYTSKVTQRGQTTLPIKIRKLLHAHTGDTLEYRITPQGIILQVKKAPITETLNAFVGIFEESPYTSEEESIRENRLQRGWDDADEQII